MRTRNPNQPVRIDPRTGERMGRFWSALARIGLIDSVVQVQTPYTQELAANAAANDRAAALADRSRNVTRAVYGGMIAAGREVPEQHRPGYASPALRVNIM